MLKVKVGKFLPPKIAVKQSFVRHPGFTKGSNSHFWRIFVESNLHTKVKRTLVSIVPVAELEPGTPNHQVSNGYLVKQAISICKIWNR